MNIKKRVLKQRIETLRWQFWSWMSDRCPKLYKKAENTIGKHIDILPF